MYNIQIEFYHLLHSVYSKETVVIVVKVIVRVHIRSSHWLVAVTAQAAAAAESKCDEHKYYQRIKIYLFHISLTDRDGNIEKGLSLVMSS